MNIQVISALLLGFAFGALVMVLYQSITNPRPENPPVTFPALEQDTIAAMLACEGTTRSRALGIAGQVWTDPETSNLVMDYRIALAFARRLAYWIDRAEERSERGNSWTGPRINHD